MARTIALLILVTLSASAQAPAGHDLFKTLKAADSVLFECGFNRCDTVSLATIIDNDFEFLHDQGGIQDRTAFFRAIRENICSGKGAKPVRRLRPESLQAYPLYDNGRLYGAVQTGIHDFYREADGKQVYSSTAKFVHTWLLAGDRWKLHRVLSFDHKSEKPDGAQQPPNKTRPKGH